MNIFKLFFLIMILTSCSPAINTFDPVGNTNIEDNYPPPTEIRKDEPDGKLETIDISSLEPEPESGIIFGKLIDKNGNPFMIELYLARIIESTEKNAPFILAYSPHDSIKATQARDGTFLFELVSPGTYGIIASDSINDFVLKNNDKLDLVFEVNANQITNLGIINID